MKQISVSIVVLFAAIAPVAIAQSLPDANPACMERNGPDCVLGTQVVPQRTAPPPLVAPPGVVIIAPAPAPQVIVAPQGKLPARGTVPPAGVVGSPEVIVPAPASPATATPGTSNVIVPSGQGSTIISPRK